MMNTRSLPYGVRQFRVQNLIAELWRNGAGLTRQIAAGCLLDRAATQAHGWDWRVSIADITAEGPFSIFEGVDRTAALVGDEKLTLLGDVAPLCFTRAGDVHAFAGEAALSAKLSNGHAQLLNVMTRRGRAVGKMRSYREDSLVNIAPTECRILLNARGAFRLTRPADSGQSAFELTLNELEGLQLMGGTSSLQIESLVRGGCLVDAEITAVSA